MIPHTAHKKVSDEVFDKILQLITSGKLAPGDKLLSEREFSETLDTGRSSVREALLKLEAIGYVEQKQGGGTFVKSITSIALNRTFDDLCNSEHFIDELIVVRKALETACVAEAALRATRQDLIRIRRCFNRMERKWLKGQLEVEANYELHYLIAKASQNTLMIHLINTLYEWYSKIPHGWQEWTQSDSSVIKRLLLQHKNIISAIDDHNPAKAYQFMSEHLDYSATLINTRDKAVVATNKESASELEDALDRDVYRHIY
jgi:GntR family transcriptional regulator, transcriptional repressor for pyruvate dehydrogenase complex